LREPSLTACRVSLTNIDPDLDIDPANSAVDAVFRGVWRTFKHGRRVLRKDELESWVVGLLAGKEDGDGDASLGHR
jgi:hypothetical protein